MSFVTRSLPTLTLILLLSSGLVAQEPAATAEIPAAWALLVPIAGWVAIRQK